MNGAPSDLERLIAAEQIRQLAYGYAFAVDSRDRELLESLWAEPDGEVDYPDINLITVRRDHPRWFNKGPTVHFVGNHLIELDDPDHAHGRVYCWAQLDLVDEFVDQSILHLDQYVRREGRWLFWQRRHLLWFGQARAENPISQSADQWPLRHTGRGNLPAALMPAERAASHLRR
jgi:SnoaL-like domain